MSELKRVLFVGYEGRSSLTAYSQMSHLNIKVLGFVVKHVKKFFDNRETIYPIYERKMDEVMTLAYQPKNTVGEEILNSIHLNHDMIFYILNRHFNTNVSMKFTLLKYKLISYCHDILIKTKPDLVSFNVTPHDPVAYLLYSLCRYFGIKTVIYHKAIFFNSVILCENVGNQNELLIKTKNMRYSNKHSQDYAEDIISSLMTPAAPKYMFTQKSQYGNVLKRFKEQVVKKGNPLKHIVKQLKREAIANDYNRHIDVHSIKQIDKLVNAGKKLLFFPLHFQPEHTTLPNGGIYAQQWLVVEWLIKCTSKDYIILVKEHPTQMIYPFNPLVRGKELYTALKGIDDRVKLVATNVLSRDIIERSTAVVTISGTITFESIFLGKNVAVFGDSPGIGLHGVFVTDTISKLKQFISMLDNPDLQPDLQKVKDDINGLMHSLFVWKFEQNIEEVGKEEEINSKIQLMSRYLTLYYK